MAAKYTIHFRGLFAAGIPQSDTNPVQIGLLDARVPFRPLELPSEAWIDRHVPLIEFRGPVEVNDVQLLGGGYFLLDGHDVSFSNIRPGALQIDRDDTGVSNAINLEKVLRPELRTLRGDLRAGAPSRLAARVNITRVEATLSAHELSDQVWQIEQLLAADPKGTYQGRFARTLRLAFDATRLLNPDDGLLVVADAWATGSSAEFRVRSIGGQDVDVQIANVCSPLPTQCGPAATEDTDFRGFYQLLDDAAGNGVIAGLARQGAGLPYPSLVTDPDYEPRPCYYVTYPTV